MFHSAFNKINDTLLELIKNHKRVIMFFQIEASLCTVALRYQCFLLHFRVSFLAFLRVSFLFLQKVFFPLSSVFPSSFFQCSFLFFIKSFFFLFFSVSILVFLRVSFQLFVKSFLSLFFIIFFL